ncbi:hypothetical protein [Natronobiforma cellulositropha]|uniref:hypothetical protein n=1 Tax=Natronobiforma cellulositropha TaxID=1679076 RepID=UPI0021D61286|nr:hypothetical protein [Natronobiforma cellulositropha]
MTDERSGLSDVMDALEERTSDVELEEPTDAGVREALGTWAGDGTLALALGALCWYRALRSTGRVRGLVLATLGTGLLGLGVRRRRPNRAPTDEEPPWIPAAVGESEAEEAEKETADDAAAALERPVVDRESETDLGGRATSEGRVPTADETDDPRRGPGEHSASEVSETDLAAEPGEATGPDAVQAEPTQTEATEPEADADAEQAGGTDADGFGQDETDLEAADEDGDAPDARAEDGRGETGTADGTEGATDEGEESGAGAEEADVEHEAVDDEEMNGP